MSRAFGPYVDGETVAGGGPPLLLVNPSTAAQVGWVETPDPAGVDTAVKAARKAFDDGRFREIPVLERQRILMRAAALIRDHAGELSHLIAEDMGMPESAARYVEVPYAASVFDFYAGLIASLGGETLPVDIPGTPPHYLAYTERLPVGVAALITPFNFPLLLPSWKLAPLLASGSTAVLKPAPEAPRVALRLVELLEEAGVPPGVVNVLPGGGDVGRELTSHPDVDMVAFTGSTAAGRRVAADAGAALKRVALELGGKSAALIFSDADLDAAVSQTLFGLYFNSGQVCQATSRILVDEHIYDAFIERYRDRVSGLRVGAATDPTTDLGPLVRSDRVAHARELVGDALDRGARLLVEGEVPGTGGFFYPATVLTDVAEETRVATDEVFGPVAIVGRFRDEETAIRQANATRYGLAAAVFTRDVARAHRVSRRLLAGTVWVNTTQLLSPTLPFGGVKESGVGRELGRAGLELYTELKTVLVDLNDAPPTYF